MHLFNLLRALGMPDQRADSTSQELAGPDFVVILQQKRQPIDEFEALIHARCGQAVDNRS
jgi:hypothetical protein